MGIPSIFRVAIIVQNQKGDMWSYRENVIVFVDDKVLGSCEDFLKWAKETFDFSDMRYIACNNTS